MARKCFYSFHYVPDHARASQVRNIGAIEGNQPISDNDWESVTRGGDDAIRRWINSQIAGKTCAIILIGSNTANRKWINYEIIRAWDEGLGVVGINIHGLKNFDGLIASKGGNPFAYIGYANSGKMLSSIVRCYDPVGDDSKARYNWISTYLSDIVEEAIQIRKRN